MFSRLLEAEVEREDGENGDDWMTSRSRDLQRFWVVLARRPSPN